jgi:NAD(P)-dependent dehydrogenase (short-subunit alcohol dehydrogenase family)
MIGMDYRIQGKLCFVTAGAHGIGEAIANILTQEGAIVIVADQDDAVLREKGHAWKGTFTADLATAAGVDAAVSYVLQTFGRTPDILINNAGLADPVPFENLSDERWARAFDINLMACVRTCRALLPRMAAAGESAVVNIASDLAKQPEPVPMDYGACKAGLLYLTKGLAKQYAPHVRVNAVAPGPIWTRLWYRPGGMADQLAAQYGVDRDAAVKQFLESRHMPLGMGQPDDVANAVVFLASPLAKFITGAVIDIGGTLRGLI